MQKKFRQITVDGDNSWAWIFYAKGDFREYQTLKIWKDKKIVFEKQYIQEYYLKRTKENRNKRYKITPGLISRFIKIFLKK